MFLPVDGRRADSDPFVDDNLTRFDHGRKVRRSFVTTGTALEASCAPVASHPMRRLWAPWQRRR